jgi:hypothetical protein
MRCGIAGERLVSQSVVSKLVVSGQTASKDIEFEDTTKSCVLGAFRVADCTGWWVGRSQHEQVLKTLPQTIDWLAGASSDACLVLWQQPSLNVWFDLFLAAGPAQCGQLSPFG